MSFRGSSWHIVLRICSKSCSKWTPFTTGFTTNGRQIYFSSIFLGFHDPVKLRLCILDFQMRVGSKRNPDIRMPHAILQRFGVHTALCHVGAEGMPEHMGCDLRKQAMTSGLMGTNRSPFLVLVSSMMYSIGKDPALFRRESGRFCPISSCKRRSDLCTDKHIGHPGAGSLRYVKSGLGYLSAFHS